MKRPTATQVVYGLQFLGAAALGAVLVGSTAPAWVDGVLVAALVVTVGQLFGHKGFESGKRLGFAMGYMTAAEEFSRLTYEGARSGWRNNELVEAVALAVRTRVAHDDRFAHIELAVQVQDLGEDEP